AIKASGSAFDSVRGEFKFDKNNMPIVDYHALEVVAEGGDVGIKHLQRVLHNHHDAYVGDCPLKCFSADAGHALTRMAGSWFQEAQSRDSSLFFSQLLNGIQLGVLLFLLSSGLTLIFGIMNFINLA